MLLYHILPFLALFVRCCLKDAECKYLAYLKTVNDAYDRAYGDLLLKQVAETLREETLSGCPVIRMGDVHKEVLSRLQFAAGIFLMRIPSDFYGLMVFLFLEQRCAHFTPGGVPSRFEPVDKSKKTAETHSGSSRIINWEIAKDGILPSA